tara:strand:+ start:835 stop:2007 length:1173 start_codon:yes stop_codon:yes gene_type:complete
MNQMMPVLKQQADGLASLGRYGDSYIVHAAEGETVIPGEILDANPQLREDLFRQMQMMGIKNPNRYVVGNSLNSINPITGQPEFYWKKLWKATKRALPALGAIIGSKILPGGAAGVGIGAGLGSLASGKNLKKSALIGGGTYLASGIASGLTSGEKTFGGKLRATGKALAGVNPFDMEELKGSFDKGSLGKTYTKKEMMPVDKGAGVYITEEVDVPFENQAFQRVAGTLNPFSKDAFVPGIVGALASEAVDPDIGETSEEQIRKAKELSDPQRFAYDQVSEYPYGSDRYYGGLRESGVYPSMDAERLARSTGISLAQARAYLASKYGVMAADGGEVIGPGTGTSDSIPARLSDGEFVMTAEAVRNAGNGDRDLGAARMYDMMSRFENGRA